MLGCREKRGGMLIVEEKGAWSFIGGKFEILLFASDGNSGPLQDTAILDALRVFGAIFDGVSSVAVGSTQRTSVRSEHGTGDFPVGVFQVMGRVEAFRFAVIATEHADLWLLGCSRG